MKVLCQQSTLNAALQAVIGVAPSKHARPILQNIKLEPAGDTLMSVCATDLEVSARHVFQCLDITDPASVVIPAHTFAGIVREVDSETVEIDASDTKATVIAGRSKFNLLMAADEEFPEVPSFPAGDSWHIEGGELSRMIGRTVFAVATEQSRYAINGVYLHAKGKTLEMVATDGRRLAKCLSNMGKSRKMQWEMIVPPKMLRELDKRISAIGDDSEAVHLGREGNQFIAKVGDTTLAGRLIEGNYPNFRDIIPSGGVAVEMPRAELLSKLKQAQILTSDTSPSLSFDLSDGVVKIASAAPERGDAALELDVSYSGDGVGVSFNPAFLADVAKVIDGESVSIEIAGDNKPAAVRDGDGYVYVIMPMTRR